MRLFHLLPLTITFAACTSQSDQPRVTAAEPEPIVRIETVEVCSNDLLAEGQQTFRFDTFGDEAFWGDQLHLHEALATVSPRTALAVGLKVDEEALPASLIAQLAAGEVDLDDPAVTAALLKIDAVVGVTGKFDNTGKLTSMGIQCAFCHSTVDDHLAPGIGKRRDGWPNRDLDVGKIISLAPNLTPFTDLLGVDADTVKQVLLSWGPGKFDAQLILDGKGFRPDGKSAATLIPAAYGLAGVNQHTYTGWGSVPYWNAFVAVLEMHGQGNFDDARLDSDQFPVAKRAGFAHVRVTEDRVTPKLAGLHVYQLSLAAPKAPNPADANAAARGEALFGGAAKCGSCHMAPAFTDSGWNMHTADEIGIDDFQASRSPDKNLYRTTPLLGLHTRSKGGYYHDGRFATLGDVVDHYDRHMSLGLTAEKKADLVAYLGTL